jgi:NAD-dependent deacetylase
MQMAIEDPCPSCETPATRPDIVWFGEMPYEMDTLFDHLTQADIFVAIGTSGNVYPAAGFVAEARKAGAHTIEFNLEKSAVGNQFAEHRIGPASQTVTDWVNSILAT